MFELILATTPDVLHGAFWTLVNLFHMFNCCNPSGIVGLYISLSFTYFFIVVLGMNV